MLEYCTMYITMLSNYIKCLVIITSFCWEPNFVWDILWLLLCFHAVSVLLVVNQNSSRQNGGQESSARMIDKQSIWLLSKRAQQRFHQSCRSTLYALQINWPQLRLVTVTNSTVCLKSVCLSSRFHGTSRNWCPRNGTFPVPQNRRGTEWNRPLVFFDLTVVGNWNWNCMQFLKNAATFHLSSAALFNPPHQCVDNSIFLLDGTGCCSMAVRR
jgi:hypothetical protein